MTKRYFFGAFPLNVTYNFLTRTDTNKVEEISGQSHLFDQFKIRLSSACNTAFNKGLGHVTKPLSYSM